MDLRELINELKAGMDEGKAAAREAEAARAAARSWADRLIKRLPPLEARALGRHAGHGDLPRSPALAALVILAASGSPEAAEALQTLGVQMGLVEGGKISKVVLTTGRRKMVFGFSLPDICRGVFFRWQAPEQAPGQAPEQAPASMGARARIKRAR
jgi:hypothetical protein